MSTALTDRPILGVPLGKAPAIRWCLYAGGLVVGGSLVGFLLAVRPEHARLLLAVLLSAPLIILAVRWPRHAAMAVFIGLPLLGLFRRVLISAAGWSTNDPLVLVAPTLAVFLCMKLLVLERRPIAPDRLSKLVLALLIVAVLQVANPRGAGLAAAIAGLLFFGVPLLWFFVGRELASSQSLTTLGWALLAVGGSVTAYGLGQSEVGFPAWDLAWFDAIGATYASLDIGGGTLRPFASFASAQEYGLFLGLTIVFAVAFATHGRRLALVVVPPTAVAVLLCGARGAVVITVVGVIVVLALRRRSARAALVSGVLGVVVVVSAFSLLGDRIAGARDSENAAVARQVGGLTDPFDEENSTLGLHLELVWDGLRLGVTNPLGYGTAAGTRAAEKLGGAGADPPSSEADFSNVFLSMGVVGGLLFLCILALSWKRAVQLCVRTQKLAPLLTAGVMVITLGQWLNGGLYALSALLWFMLGWMAREWVASDLQQGAV